MSVKRKKVVKQAVIPDIEVAVSSAEPLSWYWYLIPPSIISIVTFLFYFPSRNYEFQFDDIANITKLYDIRNARFLDLCFRQPRWIGRWLNGIHYGVSKFEPYSYRMGNIIQHILLGVIVFYFVLLALRHLKKQSFFRDHALSIATATASLFMLHPVQTQTVSYVIQGKFEGVATLLIICMSFCFWLAFTTQSKFLSALMCVLYFVIAAFACGSKEIAIMAPLLVMLVDWFFVAQGSWQEMKSRWVFHLCSCLMIYGMYLYYLQPKYFKAIFSFSHKVPNNLGNVITETPLQRITSWAYLISEFKVILHYLWIFIWPFNMSVEYDWVLSKSFFAPDSFFPFLVLLALTFFVYRLLVKNKTNLYAFGIIWFMLCIAPRSTLIPSAELIVDYKTYAASFGWLLVLACSFVWLVSYVAERFHARNHVYILNTVNVSFALLCMVGLGYMTMDRNTVWRSGLEFWGNMLKNAPGKARIYNNYGVELSQKLQKYKESIPYFQHAISMDKYYPDPHNNLAVVYAYLNRLDDAIREMKEGLRINPRYAEGYNNIAAFYLQKGSYDLAEQYLKNALALRPNYGKAFFNLSRVYAEQGKSDLALEQLKNACTRADLDNSFGFSVYAKFALDNKFFDDAIFGYKKLIEIEPQNAEHYFSLGNACYFADKLDDAIKAYEYAHAKSPSDIRYAANLGEAYFKMKEYTKALSYFEKLDLKRVPQLAVHIADCYLQLGRVDQSKDILEKVMELPVQKSFKDGAQVALANLKSKKALT
jgi:tetratricopeptide (TPR) repeat protein